MSEIETSEEVERLARALEEIPGTSFWRHSAAMIRVLANDRDTLADREAELLVACSDLGADVEALTARNIELAARVALAEGMAEALEPMARVSEVYPNARPEADVLNVHDARCVVTMADLQRARTALAAWRAAATEVGDGER